MSKNLKQIENKLASLSKNVIPDKYLVPSLWVNPLGAVTDPVNVSPIEYFDNMLKRIFELSENIQIPVQKENRNHHAIVYNMLVRYTTAYDHDGNGKLDLNPDRFGFRETGTFMKAIALLPYIHSLGVNTIYLLPITAIGIDGKKGSLGSPYAIKNHFRLEENLSEPFLEMSVETQFAAFVEAAHLLCIKVIVEFVFRTASIDSDLAEEHPEWFYWIRNDIPNRAGSSKKENEYGAPIFTREEYKEIERKVQMNDFNDLPAPHQIYKDMFTDVPVKVENQDNKIRGWTKEGIEVRIPGAFADWPPDDVQPPWDDVTYLRMYDNPDFNYIAYNTVRMYDTDLAQEKYAVKSLWGSLVSIIPEYQEKYSIDGVMIDMGHSLPSELRAELIRRAREKNPDFIFWEENFSLTTQSVEDGYNASLGYMWAVEHERERFVDLLDKFTRNDIPIPFFVTPESHNTHRAAARDGGAEFNKFCWALNCFIPGLLFIHSGFELGEALPVNTGLDFSTKEIRNLPPDVLPLFSASTLNWNNSYQITEFIRKIFEIRKRYIDPKEEFIPSNLKQLKHSNKNILAFTRRTFSKEGELLLVGNIHPKKTENTKLDLPEKSALVKDILGGYRHKVAKSALRLELKPLEVFIGFIYYHD